MTQREQIIRAVLAALQSAGVAPLFRSRSTWVGRDEGTTTLVFPKSEQAEDRAMDVREAVLTLDIVTLVWAEAEPDSAVDARLELIHHALMSNRTLGGLAQYITDQGTQWDFDDAEFNPMAVTQSYSIRYHTQPVNL